MLVSVLGGVTKRRACLQQLPQCFETCEIVQQVPVSQGGTSQPCQRLAKKQRPVGADKHEGHGLWVSRPALVHLRESQQQSFSPYSQSGLSDDTQRFLFFMDTHWNSRSVQNSPWLFQSCPGTLQLLFLQGSLASSTPTFQHLPLKLGSATPEVV